MAELGSDENKIKHFLVNLNTLQAPPKKKEAIRLSYQRTGRVRKFNPERKKEFKSKWDDLQYL